ncbi:MAG TPA: hypothetical protein VHX44_07150 [Planctomycetota bacterium]|nr:hypothetical protein [Planctomycetota bacterium]
MSKLPLITLSFWIMKICATTLGETAGDLLSMTMEVGYLVSTCILLGFFLVTVSAQVLAKSYHPLLYWTVILSTSTAGTTMSDFMDRTLGLGYLTGSLILMAALAASLVVWWLIDRSLSVQNITSRRTECLYWMTILISNTLGTALGDFLADDSGLGFFGGAVLIGALLAVIVVLHYTTTISKIALFWLAFVLTRPFGATLGDVLTKTHEKGGLNFGTVGSSAVLLGVLLIFVIYAVIQQRREAAIVAR